jgi:hypothetical protein
MREAARALALDPQSADAAEIVSRLMLEPPAEIPPEVARTVADEDREIVARTARTGARAYGAFLAFIPILLTGGNPVFALVLGVTLLANVALQVAWKPTARGRSLAVAVLNAALIALVARMFSPFFIAPGIAAIATMALVLSPDYDRPRRAVWLGLLMVAAILVPYLAERLSLLSPTMHLAPDAVTIAGLGIPDGPALAGLVLYVFAIVAAAAVVGHAVRRAERTARRHMHLQAWQLAQLVPSRQPMS